jgi:anti-sigma factor RsiW
MNCPDVRRLLHPYADGELDVIRHVEVEQHLAACAGCADQEKNLRSLRTAVSSPALYYRAPARLRNRLQLTSAPIARPQTSLRWLAMAAGILVMIGAAAAMGVFLSRGRTSADDRLAEWIVASHIRSLQVEHLTDVASADGHKVKPWFRGKLDFSPQVSDLSAEGYPLSGGRLDYLADRPVAALVYHRRLHAINLFTWPATSDEEKAVRGFDRQGFHIRHWQRSGMTYWAISDLNEQELDEFVRLVQRNAAD